MLAIVDHLLTVGSQIFHTGQSVGEVGNRTLLLEFFNLGPVLFRDIRDTGQLVVGIWKLVLTKEGALLQILFLALFVFLVNQVLNLLLELTLHFTNLWWDDVSEYFVHRWDLVKRLGRTVVKLYKVFEVRYFDGCVIRNLLEEHSLSFFCGHF